MFQTMFCEKCQQGHLGDYGSGRFCSQACARGYASGAVTHEQRVIARALRESRRSPKPPRELSQTQRNVTDRAWYARTSEEKKQRKKDLMEKRLKALRETVRIYLLSHPCVVCGEKDPIVLEFDHVRGKKLSEVSEMMRHGFALKRIMEEIEKCDVCCANCHRRRTHQRRIQSMG